MLYNPKWAKPSIFSLDGLIAWLKKQPADGAYDYTDPFNCALCQYFRSQGVKFHSVALNYIFPDDSDSGEQFPNALRIAVQGDDNSADWTFGAALARAKALR